MTQEYAGDVDYTALTAEIVADARAAVASAAPRCPVCGTACTVESLAVTNLRVRITTTCSVHGAQTIIDPFDGSAPSP